MKPPGLLLHRPGLAIAGLVLSALTGSSGVAATYVADPAQASVCPCGKKDTACGTEARPFSCLADAVARAGPGDEVIARDGVYAECLNLARDGADGRPLTVRSEHPGGAQISPRDRCGQAAVTVAGSHIVVSGFRILGPPEGDQLFGVRLTGSSDSVSDCEIARHQRGVHVLAGAAENRLARLDIHHNRPFEGLKVEQSAGLAVEACRIHHNDGCGILETGPSERLTIHASEIDDNGTIAEHGLYLKGSLGSIVGNRVHHNAGYGIHLWAAPIGTADRPYLVESNDVFLNGRRESLPRSCAKLDDRMEVFYAGGIVLGGNPRESANPADPSRGLPRHVVVRKNLVHHNLGLGFGYRVPSCDGADGDNFLQDNVISRNTNAQIVLVGASGSRLVLRHNVVMAGAGRDTWPPTLIQAVSSRLSEGALDANVYFEPGRGPKAQMFSWNELPYAYGALQAGDVRQESACAPTGPADPKTSVDRGSAFRQPDDRELAAATMGIPIRIGEGREPDPWGESFLAGADTGCGGSDPRVFPGAQEVCDGVLDDRPPDCSAGPVPADEVDADHDGYFACQGRCNVRLCDCDDHDCEVHPGAKELCNGRDDNCDGVVDEGCPPPKKP